MTNTTSTNLDDLIVAERKRSAERIAKLKRAAAAEQRRIDERVVKFLRERDDDLYEKLASKARDALAGEKAKRSSWVKKSVTPASPMLEHHASRGDERGGEVSDSWQ